MEEQELLEELQKVHFKAAQRENISTVTLLNVLAGSDSYSQAVAAAILSTGAMHAPVTEICEVLQGGLEFAQVVYVEHGRKVPGWGNSFVKGAPDYSLDAVFGLVEEVRPDIIETIGVVTEAIHERGKIVYPNVGCVTAAAAIALGMPAKLAPHLFIACRLPVWYELAAAQESR